MIEDPLLKKAVHALVVAPWANKKHRLLWNSTSRRSHAYDPTASFFTLEPDETTESGLSADHLLHVTMQSIGFVWLCTYVRGRACALLVIGDLDDVLQVEDITKRHLVLVDDWTADARFADFTSKCIDWFSEDEANQRRLAFVCAVASRGRFEEDTDLAPRAVEFHGWSWTLNSI